MPTKLFSAAFTMLVLASTAAHAAECTKQNQWDGYAFVKAAPSEKAHFFSEAKDCSGEPCAQRRKAYLVAGNFVQVSSEESDFVCVKFANKKSDTVGWLQKTNLESLKRGPLERKDLAGSWLQMPCGAGDDCMLSITLADQKAPEIDLMDHVDSHPGGSLTVDSVTESPGVIQVEGKELGDQKVTLKFIYAGKDIPPGMIRVEGDDNWYSGLYHKDK